MVGHPTSFDVLNPLQVVSVHQNWSSTLNQSIKHRWCAGVGGHYSFWLWPAACSGRFQWNMHSTTPASEQLQP